ncbi:MAG: O-antigen ligase family protein [Pseudomonadota bacterium]
MKDEKLFNLFFLLWLITIFSTFSSVAIYPLFFILFSSCYFCYLALTHRLTIRKNDKYLIIAIFCLIFWGTTVFLGNREYSNLVVFLKIIINLSFLIFTILFCNDYRNQLYRNTKKITLFLELIIFLSFIQILLNVFLTNSILLPFTGVSNSTAAFIISSKPIYFGIQHKNIWATKIVFIEIIYFSLYSFKIIKNTKFRLQIFLMIALFNSIYTFSRTAQLAFFAFLLIFLYINLSRYNNIYIKIYLLGSFLLFAILSGAFVFFKLMHLDLSANSRVAHDGLLARFDIWLSFFKHSNKLDFIMGNGISYGSIFIPKYSGWSNDNMHNVFLNTLLDMGYLGFVFYLSILYFVFNGIVKMFKYKCLLFIPFFIVINSHYLGYDNDIVVYFSLLIILSQYIIRKNALSEE